MPSVAESSLGAACLERRQRAFGTCLADASRKFISNAKGITMGTSAQQRPLAAVTGGSSGIGYELARQFAQNGYDLVIGAEDAGISDAASDLERESGVRVHAVKVDLRTSE